MDPFTMTALAVGGAVAGAASSAYAASQKNTAIRRSMDSAHEATVIQNNQELAQAQQTKLSRSQEGSRLRALAVVNAAERNVDPNSGSAALIEQQALIDEATNRSTIDTNLKYGGLRNTSQYNATTTSLRSQGQSPVLQGLLGGLQGLSTGLSIGQGLDRLDQAGYGSDQFGNQYPRSADRPER